jgi:hypothetical protein
VQSARPATATAPGVSGLGVASQEVHDDVGTQLLELRAPAASHTGCGVAELGLAVIPDGSGDWRDDDLASFEAEGHLAARQDARSHTNVFGNGDLTLF